MHKGIDRREGLINTIHNVQGLAVLLIDPDFFKEINDTLGHVIGGQMLKQAVQRTRYCVPESGSAAGLTGGEFVLIVSEIGGLEAVKGKAQDIINALPRSSNSGGKQSASVGISAVVYPRDYGFFSCRVLEPVQQRLQQASDLCDALNLGQKVIAECVESVCHQALPAVEMGAYLRGYLYAKPLPAAAFLSHVTDVAGCVIGSRQTNYPTGRA